MDSNRISVSFVGVFENFLTMMPMLDGDFCKNFFQQPENTISGFGPEGFFIRTNSRPALAVVINPQKISFIATDNESLYSYIATIKQKFLEIGFENRYSALGLNYEYEWTNLDKDSPNWLWNHFINSDLHIGDKPHTCHKLALRTVINDTNFIYTEIEPRAGIANGIFAMINHHMQQKMDSLPDRKTLASLYEQSTSVLETMFFPNIIEKAE